MVTGCVLIAFGVLVALKPQVLVVLVSVCFMSAGMVVCLMSWQWRRARRRSPNTFVNWMVRF